MIIAGTILILITQDVRLLFPFYVIFGNSYLGILVLLKDRQNKINISYAATALLTALWAVLVLLYGSASSPSAALIWSRFSAAVFAFLPIPFIYFFSVFPKEDVVPKRYQLVAWFCVASFFALISFTDLIIKNAVHVNNGYVFVPGPAFVVFIFYFLGFLYFAFSRLVERYSSYRGINRRQIVYVFSGFFLGFIFPAVTNLILPLVGYSDLTRIGPYSTVITVGFIAYAITKSHLMDISIIVSQAVAEVLAIIVHGIIYLSLVWLYVHFISPKIDYFFLAGTIAYGILVGQTHHGLRIFFQTTADKLFLRGKYDYYKALSEASSRVGEKLSLAAISKILYDTFYEVVEISNPRVFLPEYFSDPEKLSNRYLAYDKKEFLPQAEGEEIRFDDPLVQQLISTRAPVINPKKAGRELIIPCLLEDRLIGILVLGKKLSEEAYTDDDVRLLQVLANQAAIALDHTRSYEKIRIDLGIAEKQLARSQRLASIGTLTAGVTHEIRNPLTVIRTEIERLTNEMRDMEYLKNFRELCLKHIDRIEGIVQRMLNLTREKPRQAMDLKVNEVVESVLQFFNFKHYSIEIDLQDTPFIKGNPEELQQVFINLIQNAFEAIPQNGKISVKTYVEGSRGVVEVSDNGKGIPDEIKEKIFDPFFSTRHEGAGLGLSIVYRIVREHGGDIQVNSEVGKGTTFKVLF